MSRYTEDEDQSAFLCQLECDYLAGLRAAVRRCDPWLPRSSPGLFGLYFSCRTISLALRLRYGRQLREHEIHRFLATLLRGDRLASCESALNAEEPREAFSSLANLLLPRQIVGEISAEPFDMRLVDVRCDRVICQAARRQQRPVRFCAEYLIGHHMLGVFESESAARLLEARALGTKNEDMLPYFVGAA